ncbi:MAG: preprotein translocase subunit YajC [Planctomycetes bacterium]|nr:preprotein translocase subunit YajC [Planctomycetota bacterium]
MKLYASVQESTEQEPAPTGAPQGNPLMSMLVPLVVIFVLFYFLLIRPQKRQQKERDQMLAQIKKNDHVVTSGGIFGIVDKVKDNEVVLKIDERSDVRIRVLRSAIVDIRKTSGAAEEVKAETPEGSEKK